MVLVKLDYQAVFLRVHRDSGGVAEVKLYQQSVIRYVCNLPWNIILLISKCFSHLDIERLVVEL